MSDSELLREIKTVEQWADGRPVTTASELAERVGYSRQGVHHRLQALHDSGQVCKHKVGSRAAVWWAEQREKLYDSSE